MTVKELIEKLQEMPKDLEVVLPDYWGCNSRIRSIYPKIWML